jgi:nitroreductase
MAPFDLTHTDKLLTTTRAVRRRLDLTRPVESDVLLDCLRIAAQAPSGGNTQRWRWVVVRDADKKRTIRDYYRKSWLAYMEPKWSLVEGDDASVRMTASARFLADHMDEVPVLVIPCLLDRVEPGANSERMASFYGGVLPAAWSFQLALRSRGLGSAFTTLHLEYEREVSEVLGIPDTVTQAALIPVAYYTGEDFRPAPRRPIEEVTYLDGWKGAWS